MASTDGRPIPIKNTAFRVTFPIFDADGDLVTGAAGLDSEVSIDAGTFSDCTNEATEIATSSGMYYLDLTAAEMNGDTVAIIVKTSTTGAKTTPIVLYPEETGDVNVDITAISGAAVSTSSAQLGVNVVNAGATAWNSGAITANTLSASATDAIWAEDIAGVLDNHPGETTIAGYYLDAVVTDTAEIGTAGAGLTEAGGTGDHLTAVPDSSGVTTLLSRIPSALFTGITSLAEWLGLIAGKQTANSTARTEIRATGAGSGTYDETTDSQEAIRDRGDAAWTGSGSGGGSVIE